MVAALIAGQRSTRASYATRLQDFAVWKAVQLVLESFAFLMIGLQLPKVVSELAGISAATIAVASAAVVATVIVVRIVWMYLFAYLPRLLSPRIRRDEPAPTPAQVFVLGWAGMRGVVSLAAAFGVPLATLSGTPFPGRPQLVFLTFVVVVGTLLLHGLTLPWLIRRLGVTGGEAAADGQAGEVPAGGGDPQLEIADRSSSLRNLRMASISAPNVRCAAVRSSSGRPASASRVLSPSGVKNPRATSIP